MVSVLERRRLSFHEQCGLGVLCALEQGNSKNNSSLWRAALGNYDLKVVADVRRNLPSNLTEFVEFGILITFVDEHCHVLASQMRFLPCGLTEE